MSHQETLIRFGTDGWRAIMGSEYNDHNLKRLTQAFCSHALKTIGRQSDLVVVGYDWRENSEIFAQTVARILLGNGFKVILSNQACPTPAVSRAVLTHKAYAGIVITASHNPGNYNGFKIKDSIGASASPETTQSIETLLDQTQLKMDSQIKLDTMTKDIVTPYLESIRKYLKLDAFKNASFSIAVDSMHGIGANFIAQILTDTPIKVTTLRANRDIHFGGNAPEPISKNLQPLIHLMKTGEYDAGFATDGDADRIGIIRKGGDFVSPGTLLAMIAVHFVEDLGWTGDIVKTLSNTSLITDVAKKLNLNLHETPVGFKYIVDIMKDKNVLIAGEESGGIAYQNYMFERDGVLSALLMLQMMVFRNQSMEQILQSFETNFGKYLYMRTDQRFDPKAKEKILDSLKNLQPQTICSIQVASKSLMDGIKFILEDGSWILFRMSGTEPLLRIYAESKKLGMAESLNRWGIEYVQTAQR